MKRFYLLSLGRPFKSEGGSFNFPFYGSKDYLNFSRTSLARPKVSETGLYVLTSITC